MPSNWRDWLVFPSPEKCDVVYEQLFYVTDTREILHHFFLGADLVEINPELGMTPNEIARKCNKSRILLVLDIEHWFRKFRAFDARVGDPSPLDPFDKMVEGIGVLAPYISVVHVKGLGGAEQAIIDTLLHSPNRRREIDIVAEYPPLPRGSRAVKRHMAEFLEGMKTLVEFA